MPPLKGRAARASFEAYVATEADRLAAFRRAIAVRGGPSEAQLDFSRESLGPLGAWFLEPTPPGPEDRETPDWAVGEPDDPALPSPWMLEGLTAYLVGALRRAHPAVSWRLEEDRRSMHAGLPVLVGVRSVEFWPITPVAIRMYRARQAASPDPDWLLAEYGRWSELAAKAAVTGPIDADAELERDLDEVDVDPISGDPVWNAEISISEAAETVLGEREYTGLYDRFAAIPGIERIEWEDRERFLVRLGPGRRLDDIRDAVRAALREARAASG